MIKKNIFKIFYESKFLYNNNENTDIDNRITIYLHNLVKIVTRYIYSSLYNTRNQQSRNLYQLTFLQGTDCPALLQWTLWV